MFKEKGETLYSFLETSARRTPEKIALIFEDRSYTYAGLRELSQKVVYFLLKKTRFQDRVILLLANSPEFIAAYFGVLAAGRIAVPVDVSLKKKDLAPRIGRARPAIIISNSFFITGIKKDFPEIAAEDIENILSGHTKEVKEKRKVLPNHVASLLFTTGTTGEPKGVMVRHKNPVATTRNILGILKYSPGSIDINALPLTHSFGLGNVHAVFAAGGTVILHKNFINLKKILEDAERYKAISFSATPPIFELLSASLSGLFKKYNSSLRLLLTNSAPVPPSIIKKIIHLAPRASFFTYYGLTEASRSTFIDFSKSPKRLNSVGRAAPGIEISIVDEEGRNVPEGQIGEVRVKGPNVVDGYWNNTSATKERIKKGWLATGDYGYLDKDGYLFLTGRKDDILNIGGEKVYPFEIEKVLLGHKMVKEVAVIGVKDKFLGQVAKAMVVAVKSGLDEKRFGEELKSFCHGRLKSYKVPKIFELADSLPKTSSGKLQKKLLK